MEKQTTEKQTTEKQTTEKQTTEKQTTEKQTTEKQATEKQATEKQATEKQATEKQTLKDKDIREPLFEYLEENAKKVRIIEEKQIGKSRADLMMVTENALVGIEIKSDADTYARLERQVKDYNRFFDYNIAVVGSSHGRHIEEHIPVWWGIIIVEAEEGRIDFYCSREPKPNPKREKMVKLRNQLSFLWRMELAHMQELNHLPKYKEKSKLFVIQKLMEKVETETLKRQISDELFERDYTTIEEKLAAYKEEHQKGKKEKRT